MTWVEACPVKPRESVQVALTVTGPAEAPSVLRVAELPLPEIVPPLEVQLATETGTPSGLVQFADKFTLPPGDQTGRVGGQRHGRRILRRQRLHGVVRRATGLVVRSWLSDRSRAP